MLCLAALGGCPAADDVELGDTEQPDDDADDDAEGESPNPPGETGEVSETDELARLAIAMCERQQACGCEPDTEQWDPANCETDHYEGLLALANQSSEQETYAFDASCLRELAECWEQLECGLPSDGTPLCDLECAVHQLNLEKRANCENEPYRQGPAGYTSQCAPGLECLGGHGYAICDDPAPLEAGEDCVDGALHRSCGRELYCAGEDDGNNVCEPRLEEGAACERQAMCVEGLRCADGVCSPRVGVGSACERSEDCTMGLRCNLTEYICVAPYELGEQCRFSGEPMPCVEGNWCRDDRCEPELALGSACTISDWCADGGCIDGVCTGYEPICSSVPALSSYPRG